MSWSPDTEAGLSQAVADAAAAATPLHIVGGGTRNGLGHAVSGQALDLSGLTGISLYEPGALTLVAKAGTPVSEIEAALAAEGQQLPFEPMDHRAIFGTNGMATIGGVVATNASGPRRIQAGACRDSLIGVRFVDGLGRALKNGGRVMKNVTGYDLVKLLCGSFGTLGVLAEVSFKVLPRPQASALITIAGTDATQAVAAMSRALGSPFDVNGAAYLSSKAQVLLRVEGFEGSIAYRAERLKELMAPFGAIEVSFDHATNAEVWADIRDARAVAEGDGDIWRISVKPTDGPHVLDALGPQAAAQMDWGGGLVWARVPPGQDVRSALVGISGHATLVRADEAVKTRLGVFHPEPAPLAAISAGLRERFDPNGILNPGLMSRPEPIEKEAAAL